jgi:hypothetical protein
MKEMQKNLGGMANSHGSFAEEYFFNAFESGNKNFFGENFDDIDRNVRYTWEGLKDEYDIILYNHTSVAIIEIKYKAENDDIDQVLKKADTFRILSPNYKNFKVYLGLASMTGFTSNVEEKCTKEGIAIIKQVGDKVVICDDHLKSF